MASKRTKGIVEEDDEYFRAHVRCHSAGRKKHIRGPRRAIRQDAEQDLFELQAAGLESTDVVAMKRTAKEFRSKDRPERGGVEKKGRSHRAH